MSDRDSEAKMGRFVYVEMVRTRPQFFFKSSSVFGVTISSPARFSKFYNFCGEGWAKLRWSFNNCALV